MLQYAINSLISIFWPLFMDGPWEVSSCTAAFLQRRRYCNTCHVGIVTKVVVFKSPPLITIYGQGGMHIPNCDCRLALGPIATMQSGMQLAAKKCPIFSYTFLLLLSQKLPSHNLSPEVWVNALSTNFIIKFSQIQTVAHFAQVEWEERRGTWNSI